MLLWLIIAFDLASLYLVTDVLLEEPVILLSLFFGIDLWLRVRMSRCGNRGVLFAIGYTVWCCVFSSALFVRVYDLLYFVPF